MAGSPHPPPLSVEHLRDPGAVDAHLRDAAPVTHLPEQGIYLVSGYAEVAAAVRRHEDFSNRFGRVIRGRDRLTDEARAVLAEGYPPVDTLFTTDPPEHRRFRLLVSKAFSPARVRQLDRPIRQIAGALLDAMLAKGEVDLVADFAVPLPLTVISDQLGVPRNDLPLFKRWSAGVVSELGRLAGPAEQLDAARLSIEFQRYFEQRLEERRREPHDDILSDLLHARVEGERPLSVPELLMMLQQLLVAGNETTTNALSGLVRLLVDDPGLQERLRADRTIIGPLIEEALRIGSPVQGMWRVASRDTELGGVTIPEGALVMLRYGSANRDEQRFPEAATPEPDRDNLRDHLAFGAGIHFCIGASLARAELHAATELLLDRTRWIELAPDRPQPSYAPNTLLRGLDQLWIRLRSS
jgi:cytochrome P450